MRSQSASKMEIQGMPRPVPLWQSDPISYLVQAHYRDAQSAAASAPGRELKNPHYWTEYTQSLNRLKPEEIEQRVAEQLAREAEQAERDQPFNQPSAAADFDCWAKMANWKIDEAIALSLGKDPRRVRWGGLQRYRHLPSPFVDEFAEKRELAMRAVKAGHLRDPTVPSEFLEWSKRANFHVCDKLIEAVSSCGFDPTDWKKACHKQERLSETLQDELELLRANYNALVNDNARLRAESEENVNRLENYFEELQRSTLESRTIEKPFHSRERESLLKMIIGMAIKGYAYDPKSTRNTTAQEIAGDLQVNGLSLDVDTVRKYLVEARGLLPAEETEPNPRNRIR